MIKKFIDKLLGKPSAGKPAIPKGKRVEVPVSEHQIDLGLVDDNAIRVVKTLADAGYEAYIVGGAVRDLLVGLRPKDFDVATNATPEQVKGLFRRAFIIGRRFRIVHVVFGRGREHEVIEVSTFRALVDASAVEQVAGNEKTSKAELANKHHAVDAAGRVLRDNVWGPQIEDAARRDFTVNAMYYDPQKQIVVDYHGGIKDAKKKVLRMIGDPVTRYREDPVRIIRVIRFAAKLGFSIDPKTRAPIQEMASLLESVPASRTFDEMIKLLQTGHALSSIKELQKQGLVGARTGVFPILDVVLADANKHPERAKFVELALADTDRRVNEGKPVAPSFMLACMLWHDVLDGWSKLKKRGEAPFPALQQAVDSVFDARIGDISGRGKLGADMREIWLMQTRFERRTGQGPLTLVEQPRFRAGFDFLRLRADAGEIEPELAQWWERFSTADADERAAMLSQARSHEAPRRRAPAHAPAAAPAAESDEAAEATDAPRKRRRRRRKPGGGADAGASSSDPQ
ncbi:polynucleotide adenylyltransferase PcnB [Sphaerotilaceae bacterium SBD11-9]